MKRPNKDDYRPFDLDVDAAVSKWMIDYSEALEKYISANQIKNIDEISNLKFEILNYVISESFTIDGLANKLNELTKLCTSID